MNPVIINLAILLVGTSIAAYTDYKSGIVPDKLSHFMIISGVILAPIVYNDLLFVYGVAAVVFGLGFAMYSFGQLGGGDVKLFTAIALLVPFYPEIMQPVVRAIGISPALPVYPFIGSVFILAGLIGPMFVIPIRTHFRLIKNKNKIPDFSKKVRKGFLLVFVLIPLLILWFSLAPAFIVIFIPMGITISLLPFKEDMIRLFYSEKKLITELNDDDVLALEEIDEEMKEDLGLWRKTFTPPELEKIKKKAEEKNYEEIKVCENLPIFVPYILLAILINLFFGDAFFYLVRITV